MRLKLGLKKYERFQFTNQKNDKDMYYFSDTSLIKMKVYKGTNYDIQLSGVSLNWLLDDECEIRKVGA